MNSSDHIRYSSSIKAYDRGLLAGYLYATKGMPYQNPYYEALRTDLHSGANRGSPAIKKSVSEYRPPNLKALAQEGDE